MEAIGLRAPRKAILQFLVLLGLFIIDIATPLGTPVWVLYPIAFVFIPRNVRKHYALIFAGLYTVLIAAAYLLSPMGRTESAAHRGFVLIFIWGYAFWSIRSLRLPE